MTLPKIPTGPYAHVVLALVGGIMIGVSAAVGLQTYAAPARVQMVAAVPVQDAVRAKLTSIEGTIGLTLEELRALRRDMQKAPAVKAKTAAK